MPLSLNILCYLFVSEIFFPPKNCDDKFWLSLRWLYQNQPHASVPIFAEMETLLRHYEIFLVEALSSKIMFKCHNIFVVKSRSG